MGGTVIIQGEKLISRPLTVVQSQFVDMVHHASTRVHAGLEVTNVRPHNGGCLCTGRRRIFGILQEDEFEVMRLVDGSSTLRSLSGSNVGLLITQTFESLAADRTCVRITVELPVKGPLALLVPLVRMNLRRALTKALEEDRIDLEQRGYPTS